MLRLDLKVFVASPGDVGAERQILEEVIAGLAREPHIKLFAALTPGLYERVVPPVQSASGQQAVEEYMMRPADCDVMVAVFGNRLGTPMRDEKGHAHPSGSAYEVKSALKALPGSRILLYRSRLAPVPPDEQGAAQLQALERFLEEIREGEHGQRLEAEEITDHDVFRARAREAINAVVWRRLIIPRMPRRLAAALACLVAVAALLYGSRWLGARGARLAAAQQIEETAREGDRRAAQAWSEVVSRGGAIPDASVGTLRCALVPPLLERLEDTASDAQTGRLIDAIGAIARKGHACACEALVSVLDLEAPRHRHCAGTHRRVVEALGGKTCGDRRELLCRYHGKIARDEALSSMCSTDDPSALLPLREASARALGGREEARRCGVGQ
jgi:hypothetical protein